ncbi:MAG: hypothetical protein GXO42_00985 [bacterium]|nr:hypothetical protein [bacterium]
MELSIPLEKKLEMVVVKLSNNLLAPISQQLELVLQLAAGAKELCVRRKAVGRKVVVGKYCFAITLHYLKGSFLAAGVAREETRVRIYAAILVGWIGARHRHLLETRPKIKVLQVRQDQEFGDHLEYFDASINDVELAGRRVLAKSEPGTFLEFTVSRGVNLEELEPYDIFYVGTEKELSEDHLVLRLVYYEFSTYEASLLRELLRLLSTPAVKLF